METQARKGDLALIQKRRSSTDISMKTTVIWTWQLIRVRNVRDGIIKSFETMNAYGQTAHYTLRANDRDYGQRLIIGAHKINAEECFRDLCACEFSDIPSARDAVRHYLVEQRIAA